MSRDYLDRVARRVVLALARGIVRFVGDTGAVQRIQVQLNALEIIDDIPRMAEYGFVSNPPAGSDAVVAFGSGDRSNGVVIATGNSTYRMKQLKTGEVAIHDNSGQSVYLTAAGIVINGAGKPMTITNIEKLRAETLLFECTGDIVDNCDTTGRSMAADRVIYDGHEHDVTGIQKGDDTVTSNKPTQTE